MSISSTQGHARFVGRVGGLAIALGIGVSLGSLSAVAAADQGTASESVSAGPQHSAPASEAQTAAHGTGRSKSRKPAVRASAAAATSIPATARPTSRRAAGVPSAIDVAAPTARATTAGATVGQDLLGGVASFLGLPGAPATAAPTVSSLTLLPRLTIDDIIGGSAPSPTADAATVITGLFREVLRRDPTTTELQSYQGIWQLTGINGVVAGLYGSTAFRQIEVNNYYLELLGRPATQQELDWGVTRLIWGTPEPVFAASIAGSREFYQASSSGGGAAGRQPSATTYVNLLYRSMLGTVADSAAAGYVFQVEAGVPTELVSLGFALSEPYRAVKVNEIFNVVLDVSPTPDVLNSYLQNWFLLGGLAGIATLALASGQNVTRIESGQVALPDMVAVSQMQQLLLAPYNAQLNGFVDKFNNLLGNPSQTSPCTMVCANQPLYDLMIGGGSGRAIPNNAIQVTTINASVADLIPTQNEIGMSASLKFPLQNPTTLQTYFDGGDIKIVGPILTADNGKYVIDGHHRWSQLLVINPYARIVAEDIGYVPNPQEALRQAQIAVAAQLGYLKSSTVLSDNLYTVTRNQFDAAVADYIDKGASKDAVIDVFTLNLGLEGQSDAEKMTSIQNYLWDNVERMRVLNPYIPGATSRVFMPQVDPQIPILNYMRGPSPLSYSFPIIGYLG